MAVYVADTHALLWYLTALRIQPLTVLPDIHHRLIVAETLSNGAALITRDQAITALGLLQTVW